MIVLVVLLVVLSEVAQVNAFYGNRFTHALTFELSNNPEIEDPCFLVDAKNVSDKIYVHFQSRMGSDDFTFFVRDPSGLIVFSSVPPEHTNELHVYFQPRIVGSYSICFENNPGGRFRTRKLVSVAIAASHSLPKDTSTRLLSQVEQVLEEIRMDQAYMKARERVHRDTGEDTNGRVMLWAMVEGLLLVAMGFGQVWYLRRLFERRPMRAA